MSITRALVVFRKEVVDLFRDVKTIVVSILVPLVLFPLSFGVMEAIGVTPETEHIDLYLGDVPVSLERFLEAQPALTVHLGAQDTAERLMGAGRLDILLVGGDANVTILFDSRRSASVAAADRVRVLYTRFLDAQQRAFVPADGELASILASELTMTDRGPGAGVALLALLLPLLLLVASAVSAMPSAADVAAGEKERATIAPLLATSAAPIDLMLGKLMAVGTLAAIGTGSFIGGIVLSQLVAPGLFGESAPALAPTTSVAGLVGVALLITLLFASLELVVSLFAGSPKEAQAYLLPILIISLGCGYVATTIDPLAVPAYVFHIPIVNLAALVKLLALGLDPGLGALWAVLWTVAYVGLTTTTGLLRISSERMIL